MPYSTTWQDLVSVGQRYGKGVPLSQVTPQIANFVSSDMYLEYPWKETIQNVASTSIMLLDSTQDYSVEAPFIDRLTKASIRRWDTTPNEVRELDVLEQLAVDLYPRSYYGIRACSLEKAKGLFRLEAAVQVSSGVQLSLECDYKQNVVKVTALTQPLWFDDKYAFVALEGLLYYIYKLNDDSRAGVAQADATGRGQVYTGQLGTFKAALNRMKASEDYGFTDSVFPGDVMGIGRDQTFGAPFIFGN